MGTGMGMGMGVNVSQVKDVDMVVASRFLGFMRRGGYCRHCGCIGLDGMSVLLGEEVVGWRDCSCGGEEMAFYSMVLLLDSSPTHCHGGCMHSVRLIFS